MTKPQTFWTSLAFTMIFVPPLPALAASVSHAQIEGNTRALYDKSPDVPNDFFFPYFVEFITDIRDDHDWEHRLEDLQGRLELESRAQAVGLWNALTLIRDQNRESKQRFMRSVVCPLDVPRPTGKRVFEVLDEFDDQTYDLGRSNLNVLRRRLSPNSYQRLKDWVSEKSSNAKIIVFDHAKLYEGRSADTVRQNVCGRFDSVAMKMQHKESEQ